MQNDLSEVICRVATFLDKQLTKDQINKLLEWLGLETMRKNPALNHNDLYKESGFIRKGKVGTYKEEMSKEWIEKFENWTEECLKGFDFKSEHNFYQI